MILVIQSISKQLGERDIMWSNTESKENKDSGNLHHLSKEIFGSFGLALVIALTVFWFLNECANILLLRYVEEELLIMTEEQLIGWQYQILGFSMLSGVALFVVLFLSFVGERLAYIKEIVKGIDALGRHEWEYEIPIKGQNELTELAKRVNLLSKEEQLLREKEKRLQEEKESLIRSLSHDIRTPLTSLLSYSEFLKEKAVLGANEINDYMTLVEQKSQQIKVLTDRLLDGGNRSLETIENGRFLMEQLVDEWSAGLEDVFALEISLDECPNFKGEFDIQELRRIFDNLASNISKYADEREPVVLTIGKRDGRICIFQSNKKKILNEAVESTKIGIGSIEKIASYYGGRVQVVEKEETFEIKISLTEIKE